MEDIIKKLETARNLKNQGKLLESYYQFKEVIDSSSNIDNCVKREFSDILCTISNDFKNLSFSIIEQLSQQGDVLSSGRLARYYRDGFGCKKDINESIKLYSVGCDQYHWMKVEMLELMLENSSFGEIKKVSGIEKIFDRTKRSVLNHTIHIDNDIIYCKFESKKRIDLTLYHDGIVSEKKFVSDDNCNFKLHHSGIYRISGKVRNSNIYFETKNIHYFTDNDKNEFNHFLSQNTKENEFSFYYLNYPFYDFVITNFNNLSLDSKLISYNYGNNYLLTTGRMIKDMKLSKIILLSGYFHDKDHLIWGQNDFENYISQNNYSLSDKVGCFDSVSINMRNKIITLNTDVFGLSKLYVYIDKKNHNYIMSNRYHLLVISLSKLGIKLEFDQNKLSCMLSMSYGMLTDQFTDNNCLLSGTNIVPIDHQVQIDYNGNVVIQSLDNLKFEEKDFSEETYLKILKEVKSEFQANLNSYFNSKHFNNYFADLTGGVDSRLVFSILSLNKDNCRKVKLLSGGAIKDVKCAQSIAEKFNFNYGKTLARFSNNKFNETLTDFDVKEYTNLILSYELGTTFDHSTLFYPRKLDGTLHITGCAGEVCTRPYMCKRFFNIPNNCSKQDLINLYYQNIANYVCLSSDRVERMLNSTFSNISDNDIEQKCEDFLINRTRYHFDPHLKISFSDNVAIPLLSIQGFKTLRATLRKFNSYKFVFDLLNDIDPNVASCEYESFKDNISLAIFSKDEGHLTQCNQNLSNDYISFANDKEASYVMKNGEIANSAQLRDTDFDVIEYCLSQLNNLLIYMVNHNIINKDDGIDLWHLVKNCRNKKYKYSNQIILGMFKKFSSIVVINNIMEQHSNNKYKFKEKTIKTYTRMNEVFIEL